MHGRMVAQCSKAQNVARMAGSKWVEVWQTITSAVGTMTFGWYTPTQVIMSRVVGIGDDAVWIIYRSRLRS